MQIPENKTQTTIQNTKVGIVIVQGKTPNPHEFVFQLLPHSDVNVGDFISVEIENGIMFGKVSNIRAFSKYYKDPSVIDYFVKEERRIEDIYSPSLHRFGEARVLCFLTPETIDLPHQPVLPGNSVTRAEDTQIARYLGLQEDGLLLGQLKGQEHIKIRIDPEIFLSHHIAILGTTGSGKSYTNGVLIEELLKRQIPCIIIDPHGEYRRTLHDIATTNALISNDVVLRVVVPSSEVQMVEESETNSRIETHTITINPLSMGYDIFSELVRASEAQKDLLILTLQKMREENTRVWNTHLFFAKMDQIAQEYRFSQRTSGSLQRKIRVLEEQQIIGKDTPLSHIVPFEGITIVDLSEARDEVVQRTIAAVVIMKIFEGAKRNRIPPAFLIVEEAHIFAPQDVTTASKWAIRKVAREGRKFGVGIGLTSQRIVGLDKDALSQCNTKITLRIDSRTDIEYIRPFLAFAYSDEIELLPRLPNGTAIISGISVRTPVITQIRTRLTYHGGIAPKFLDPARKNIVYEDSEEEEIPEEPLLPQELCSALLTTFIGRKDIFTNISKSLRAMGLVFTDNELGLLLEDLVTEGKAVKEQRTAKAGHEYTLWVFT